MEKNIKKAAVISSFRIQKDVLVKLQHAARKQNRTTSNLINTLILKYLNGK